ncbi:hypothetical protein IW261DRAFT_286100 [Armillaria novae-zelandiae]|uniref:Uncharacterized protein n=1 Tax=Armillaria novae-zelandiae TaxID=153914 RepID=A0AA39P4V6_9AGAR|nr:hypothetical protein IW261DRAFT_286100 [Armillaria novae-zelandiae]
MSPFYLSSIVYFSHTAVLLCCAVQCIRLADGRRAVAWHFIVENLPINRTLGTRTLSCVLNTVSTIFSARASFRKIYTLFHEWLATTDSPHG